MEAGRPEDELVALISRATLPDQRVIETTLGACTHALQICAGTANPHRGGPHRRLKNS